MVGLTATLRAEGRRPTGDPAHRTAPTRYSVLSEGIAFMKIAILGTRGVPAMYSGFETCAEELGSRLAARGHDVTVYCRNQYLDYPHSTYKGMKLVKIPTIKNKYLDSMVHTFISCLHAAPRRYDI